MWEKRFQILEQKNEERRRRKCTASLLHDTVLEDTDSMVVITKIDQPLISNHPDNGNIPTIFYDTTRPEIQTKVKKERKIDRHQDQH